MMFRMQLKMPIILINYCYNAAGAHSGHDGANASAAAPNDITGPEERLAFALSDGRVGVLAVKGRKVRRFSCFPGSETHATHRYSCVQAAMAGFT
jgi:hypothetical protein